MKYSLCIVSSIPVVYSNGKPESLDLWVIDLKTQLQYVSHLTLVCPISARPPSKWTQAAVLPDQVEVISIDDFSNWWKRSNIVKFDLIQIPGGNSWSETRAARRIQSQARKFGVKTIVGISSNRARAAVLNANQRGWASRLRAYVRSTNILLTQKWLTGRADGAFGVGEGTRQLLSKRCPAIHISIASWTRVSDLEGLEIRQKMSSSGVFSGMLCVAARLEPMKGIGLAIEAVADLFARIPSESYKLTIIGEGPQHDELARKALDCRISQLVSFVGQLNYPSEFYAALQRHEFVLLTNLSDEQPRLLFDAIIAGSIPICPTSPGLLALSLPDIILYERGSSKSLVEAIKRVRGIKNKDILFGQLRELAQRYSLDSMHRERAKWIRGEILENRSCEPYF